MNGFVDWLTQTEHFIPLAVVVTIIAALWSGGRQWSQVAEHGKKLIEHGDRLEKLEDILPHLLTREEFMSSTHSVHAQLTAIMTALIRPK